MSSALGSPGDSQTNRKSTGDRWRQVLELGERLLSLRISSSQTNPLKYSAHPEHGVILAQGDLVVQTAADLGGGRAELWLPKWLSPEFSELTPQEDASRISPAAAPETVVVFSEAPASRLMRAALDSRRTRVEGPVRKATALAIPLLAPDPGIEPALVLGILSLLRPDGPAFQRAERELFEGLATQAALAIQASRQIAREHRWEQQLAAISEVGNAITSILDQAELLQQVVDLIHERFGFPFIHLFSVHPGRRKIFFEAGSGIRSQVWADEGFAYDFDDPAGLITWAAQHGETALVNDVSQDPRYRPAPIFPQETRAELTIPLKFGKEVLGVLDIQSDQPGVFGEAEQFLFEALAGSIAIAMRNASLFHSEVWRRQVADSLREVAGLLSADVDLEEVLNATLAELERNLPCDLAAIWFLEDQATSSDQDGALPPLRLAAVRGASAAWLEPQLGLNIDEILDLNENQGGEGKALAPTWLVDALRSEQPMTRSGGNVPDQFGALLEFPADYSAVAGALRVGEARLGLLNSGASHVGPLWR